MFIELHDYEDGYQILVNVSSISFISAYGNETQINVVNECWTVKESYEQVRSLLDVASLG